ncbi:hypothetical protein M408DRAFT_224544 [Serendipita vermifera MAFF 305830]|uniref:VWFA domain-containing protein n=1 Tax=Serendipita vermifera MAFF 305830 TaxID=933852 RepID=A0A0C2WER3_SERVB|nr:hypothetical protein M408DRAFT_224544 [Serendipita vermifera MAFF 305830]
MDSDAASDVSMHTAPSRTPSPSPLPSLVSKDDVNFSNFVQIPMVLDEPEEKPVVSEASADLLSRLPGVYRLLDLVQDQSSGGVVDKIIIAQKSIAAFANTIHPGSYRSDIQVDFKALDEHVIKPRGIYGSASAIVDFLGNVGCADEEVQGLLLRRHIEPTGITSPALRPGLYLVKPENSPSGLVYIVFWPENDTWQDGAISSVARNRVTFMRYLTKLCDQLDCLISDEHSDLLVWKDETAQDLDDDDEYSSFGDRMIGYTVEQTKEEEENVLAEEGFVIRHHLLGEIHYPPRGYPLEGGLDILQPRLIGGEVAQAILGTRYIPEELKPERLDETLKTVTLKDLLSIKKNPVIFLNEFINPESLDILLKHGLWERCGDLQSEWNSRNAKTVKAKEDDRTREMTRRREIVKGERLMLEQGAMFWIVKQVASMYPVVSAHQLFQDQLPSDADLQDAECEMAITKIDSWLDEKRNIRQLLMQVIVDSVQVLSTGTSSRYNMLKRRLLQLINIQNQAGPRLPQLDGQWLAELVTTYSEKVFQDGIDGILNREKKSTGVVGWFFGYGTGSNDTQIKMDKAVGNSKPQDDPSFCKTLEIWARERPESHLATTELRQQIAELLKRKIKALSKKVLGMVEKMLNDAIDQEIWSTFEKRTVKEHEDAWRFLREQVRQRLAYSNDEKNNRVKLTIDSVHQIKQTYGYQQNFSIKGWRSCPKESGFEYTIFPVDIKQDDMLAISSNPDHICKPIIRPRNTQPFFLPTNASMRFIQLLEKDRVLVVVEESGLFRVYLEALDYLSSTIAQGRAIKTIYSEKVGPNPLFALDETRRFFAVLATKDESVQLYVYAYDGNTKSLNARGSAEPLTRWFDRNPKFTQLLFVPKAEELLLIEKSGVCRIFSLVTATFRPSQLRLSSAPESAFSSPDGACLVMKLLETSRPRLLVYHWTSFGLNEGTELPWPAQVPADSPMLVSSVGHRHSNHAIFIIRQQHRCLSICLRISTKSSEFAFRSVADASRSSDAGKKTVNNTLIDCHPEVWTRFPVNAAIVKSTVAKAKHYPRSILFVSRASLDGFAPYFDALIREFEYKTRKPTKNALKQIVVASSSEWISSSPNIETSEFQTGDWLVGLFCLIPIHLAVTRSNRFIPLKDGVDSPTFEHSLLGANVAQISEALSFGWYESIFSSYLANRPVKVVTSMGEQSVGKSFALNHFVDTSFAGSAMRCTEGVWLSVTPTNDYLVVAMDFEGVHSIERSTQEDALLVLLNSAISNFVLFRNNFALSRDITGLFNSFQSCTKVLDPALNPSLFHSTLGIIIKDVIDSDTKEIINEFQQKFQRIVQTERGNNFISKLHRGKLDIIPWPVIESTHFYDLFIGLKKRLDRQPITHKHAGSFLGVLKMLMAKLKANDWGALDQNLAVQRAQHLSAFLPVALAFGTTDPVNEEQLKNYDTDELLDNNDSRAIFFIDGLSHPLNGPLSLDVCLTQLRLGWDLRQERYTMAESEFITGYNGFLRLLVEARIDHVQKWVEVNTSRFREKAEVTTLLRAFDQLSKDLKASVVLCGSKCSSCGLLCLGHKQHDGDDHNCMTDHKCPEPCGFEEQHEEIIGCDLPAGHIGRHVCSGTPHLCGMQCQMFGRNGCLTSCTKPMDHDEVEGHQCAAGMHTCGEQCSLVQTDGTRLCSRLCTLDCRVEHEKHTCDRSLSCPIKCQLCNSYCATGDHFHALEPSAVHLCGQKHNCTQKCELPGVCEINTTPQSIESTFTGKYTSFQVRRPRIVATKLTLRRKCTLVYKGDILTTLET